MKHLKAVFVLALAVFVSVPAFAETQNVKVSGSIDSYWFNRTNYDLTKGNDVSIVDPGGSAVPGVIHGGVGTVSGVADHQETANFFRTNTQVEVAADLTDNVSTVVNLVNERDWNSDIDTTAPTTVNTNEFDVMLDLAYVQMKEIFYSPLTLTIGRQDLWFGRGFIIGNNNRMWNTNLNLAAPEYSVQTAFDAIRATLDFNPWTLDFVYSNVKGGSQNAADDLNLYIANINYKFSEYNAVAEGYFVSEQDRNTFAGVTGAFNNDTETLGGRVQFDPISQITLGGEAAYQFGNYRTAITAVKRDRGAWAADIFGTYRWDNTWKPELTLEYVFFSGEGDVSTTSSNSYGAWNTLYRGKFWTAYADFREVAYSTGDAVDQSAGTNQQFVQVKGSLKPLEDLLLEASFTYLWNDKAVNSIPALTSSSTRNKDIGYEIDLQATYDYTEDVSFGLLTGWFVPGNFYTSPNDATATDVVGSVKVTF